MARAARAEGGCAWFKSLPDTRFVEPRAAPFRSRRSRNALVESTFTIERVGHG